MAASASRPDSHSDGSRPALSGPRPVGRLTRRAEFLAVASGRRLHTPRMTVQSIMRPQASASFGGIRIGYTVTKKIGHATERNRIRRRLREAARIASHGWPPAALDVVVIARRDAISAPFEALVADLTRTVQQLASGKGSAARPRPDARASAARPARTSQSGAKPADADATSRLSDPTSGPAPHDH